jgi:hypothetical protein
MVQVHDPVTVPRLVRQAAVTRRKRDFLKAGFFMDRVVIYGHCRVPRLFSKTTIDFMAGFV